jgi:hypothetical protein
VVKGVLAEPLTLRHFQSATATVDSVLGEVYWEVAVGEKVRVADYVAPPRMLSIETSEHEVVCSLGEYWTPADVAKAFGVKTRLPAPSGVGAQQPNPFRPAVKSAWRAAGLLFAAAVVLDVVLHLVLPGTVVFERALRVERPAAAPVAPGGEADGAPFVSEPFEIPRSTGNVEARLSVNTRDATWMGVEGALVDVKTGAVRDFNLATDVADPGKVLAEADTAYLGSVPGGTYTLRLQPVVSFAGAGVDYQLRLRRAVASNVRPWAVGFLLLVPALIVSMCAGLFEGKRWAESDHG